MANEQYGIVINSGRVVKDSEVLKVYPGRALRCDSVQ